MADAVRYVPFAFALSGTARGFESLDMANDAGIDEIRSGAELYPNLRQVIRKRPAFMATLLDPSILDAWQQYGSGQTYTSVGAYWRALEQDGGPAGAYISKVSTSGVIMPVALNAPIDSKATLDIMALPHFAAGTAITTGTSSVIEPTIAKAYYPTSIVVGSDTETAINSLNVNWQYDFDSDDQLEPTYYVYPTAAISGSASLKDIGLVSEARFEDGSTEAVTINLTDANNDSNTVQISLGNCKVFTTISGGAAQIAFSKLAA
jgi:hypothetical protein